MLNGAKLLSILFAFLGSLAVCAAACGFVFYLCDQAGLDIVVPIMAVPLPVMIFFGGMIWVFSHYYRFGRFALVVIFLALIGSSAVAIALLGAASVAAAKPLGAGALPLLLVATMFYAWVVYAFLHYRQGRQEEFVQFLVATTEAKAPLVQALDAFLRDRPQGVVRDTFVILLMLVLPGYYWFWYQKHRYDRKLALVADLLEQGYSLSEALAAVPGVASREIIMLARLGQSTAQLDRCLRHSLQDRYATVWLEVLPRVAYPLALLYFILGIFGFWSTFLFPKLERIFHEFDRPMPASTALLGDLCEFIADNRVWLGVGFLLVLGVVALLLVSTTARWYCPIVGRFYRQHIQAQVIRLLGLLLEAGKTVPEALHILADSEYFPEVARRRLASAGERVEQGQPLAASLRACGLLPKAMAPLVQAAERLRNLPWALAQLGEQRIARTVQAIRRLSMLASPATVFGVGLLVGFTVLAMFIPLLDLMESLIE